jgi:hypothetical protein
LADKLTPLILDALGRAALAPNGTPLVGTRTVPGLFPATNLGRQAARKACDDGLLTKVLTDPPAGRRELVAVTVKGREFLLEQSNPKQVLEDLVRAVEARHEQVGELIDAARRMQSGLDAIKDMVEQVLPSVSFVAGLSEAGSACPMDTPPASLRPATEEEEKAAAAWIDDLCEHLSHWHDIAPGDCPLPELYRHLLDSHPDLTIGRFHDGLRTLHDRERVYLHPWTGPLYALPEPAFALLIGHEIAYYASLRTGSQKSGVKGQKTACISPNGAAVNSQGWSAAEPLENSEHNSSSPEGAAVPIDRPVGAPSTRRPIARGSAALHPWQLTAAPLGRNPAPTPDS